MDEHVALLQQHENLEELTLLGTYLDGRTLGSLPKTLKELSLASCPLLSTVNLLFLQTLGNLQKVDLCGVSLSSLPLWLRKISDRHFML